LEEDEMRIDICKFLKDHKVDIDAYIEAALKKPVRIDDRLRCAWVCNDEWLNGFARNKGVIFSRRGMK
jgi:hypothetical protein